MATDLNFIKDKESNNGATDEGRLKPEEFNAVLSAVRENQIEVVDLKKNVSETVKKVTLQGKTFSPDATGNVVLETSESKYNLSVTESYGKTTLREGEDFIFTVTPKVTENVFNEETGIYETVTNTNITLNVDFYYVADSTTDEKKVVYSAKVKSGSAISYNYKNEISSRNEDPCVYAVATFATEGKTESTHYIYLNVVYLEFTLQNFNNTNIRTEPLWNLSMLTYTPENNPPTISVKIGEQSFEEEGKPGNSQITVFPIDENAINEGKSGVRTLEASASIKVPISGSNSFETISSEIFKADYIYVNPNEDSNEALIASNLADNTEIARYSNLVVPYWIYLKDAQKASVTLGLYNSDDTLIPGYSSTQEVSFSNSATRELFWSVSLVGSEQELEGDKFIKISCKDTVKKIPIKITEATLDLSDVPGYEAYFSAANRSNGEVDEEGNKVSNKWENKNTLRPNIKMLFSDHFDFVDGASGWVTDSLGATSLHIKKGDRATLTYKPFEKDITWAQENSTKEGLTFSIEFTTSNCINKNAIVVDCLDENGKGFQIKANSAFISDSKDTYSCEYQENNRIKLDLVVSGTQSVYKDPIEGNPTRTWSESLIWIFVDGVYQLVANIGKDFSLKQLSPKEIILGSDECELDVYSIRIYKNPLDFQGILRNYSFDSPVPSDKILIAQRNNIFEIDKETLELKVSENLLREARPELPIMKWAMAEGVKLPVDKDNWKDMESMSFSNPMVENSSLGMATFTTDGSLKNQGSSSMRYPIPYRNYDWKGGTFNFKEGSSEKYKLYDEDPGVKKLTFKKDYASSEMANNICCSELFTDMAAGVASTYIRCLSPTMEVAYKKDSTQLNTYRLSLKGTPMFVYYTDNSHSEMTPLGMFNFIPNKSEVKYLGFVDSIEVFNKDTSQYDTITLSPSHTHMGYLGGPTPDNLKDFDFVAGDVNNYPKAGTVAQAWEIRDNFVYMDDILPPAHYEASYESVLDENGDEVLDENNNPVKNPVYALTKNSSIWMKYEARYPKDSLLHWKTKRKTVVNPETGVEEEVITIEQDGDFGCHTDKSMTPGDFENATEDPDSTPDIKKSRQECAELLDFHNWVASTNPKKATGLPLKELEKVYTGDKVFTPDDLEDKGGIYSLELLKEFCELDREGNLKETKVEGVIQYINKFTRWKAPEESGLNYPGWNPTTIVMLNASSTDDDALDSYSVDGNKTYLEDTADYRRAKFTQESEYHWNTSTNSWAIGGRLRLEQWLLYYIWMEQFWMMDSGSKNLQIYTMGRSLNAAETAPLEWGCMVRDADTGLGIDNEGRFEFPPYLEDVDFIKDKSAINDKDKFQFNLEEEPQGNFAEVLNGQKGVMWKNLRDCFGRSPDSKIGELYRELISNTEKTSFGLFGDNSTINKFDNHQNKWCEALYDFGSLQYHGTEDNTTWIRSGLGNKKHQRRNWLYYGFRYRMSKYNYKIPQTGVSYKYSSDSTVNLQASVYSPIYTRTGDTANKLDSYNYKRHALIENTATLRFPAEAGDTMHYLYDSDLYTDLGNLYEIGGSKDGISSLSFEGTGGSRLRTLRLGNRDDLDKYVNNKLNDLNIGSLVELQTLDLSSCISFESSLDLSKQIQLENLYCENTLIPSVTLPKTSSLKEVWLPTSVNSIKLEDLPNLKTDNITVGTHIKASSDSYSINQDWSNVKELTITNCPNINSLTLLNNVIDNGLTTLKINNINWDFSKKTSEEIKNFFSKLIAIPSINLSGVIDCGKVTECLTYEIKLSLAELFGDIDNESNALHIKYTEGNTPLSAKRIELEDKIFFDKVGDKEIEFSIDPAVYDFKIEDKGVKVRWSISDTTHAEFTDDKQGILTVKSIGNGQDSTPEADITLTVYSKNNVPVSVKTKAQFYLKVAKPGDIVCADGSFYSPEEYTPDPMNYPIGICYYAEAPYTKADGTVAQRRLMASAYYKVNSGINANNHSASFGPTVTSNSGDIEKLGNLSNLKVTGLDGITKIQGFLTEKVPGSEEQKPLENLANSEDLLNSKNYYVDLTNDKFIKFDGYYSLYGQLGYTKLTKEEADILGDGYSEGDIIPFGKKNTLLVLKFRDKVLAAKGLEKPAAGEDSDGSFTKLTSAERLMMEHGIIVIPYNTLDDSIPDDGLLYYPAFTIADCFVPPVGKESMPPLEKFKEGNWFVPAVGDLVRLKYYYIRYNGNINNSESNVVSEEAIDGTDFSKTFAALAKDNTIFKWNEAAYVSTSSVVSNSSTCVMYNLSMDNVALSSLPRAYPINHTILCCEF